MPIVCAPAKVTVASLLQLVDSVEELEFGRGDGEVGLSPPECGTQLGRPLAGGSIRLPPLTIVISLPFAPPSPRPSPTLYQRD